MLAAAERDIQPPLPRLPLEADLFGRVLWDHYQGRPSEFFLRRDDNYVDRDGSARFFRSFEQMPAHQHCLMDHARDRILDFGAGAGQHALALQERGSKVVAIDNSALAVEVCHARGVRDVRFMNGMDLTFPAHSFDTVLMLGNNLGIAGTPEGLHYLLTGLRRIVRPGGQILAEFTDYTATHDQTHLRYHQWNQSRDKYPGTFSWRIEYQGHCGPEFDWLRPQLSDLRRIAGETGWKIARCVQVTTDASYAIAMEPVTG